MAKCYQQQDKQICIVLTLLVLSLVAKRRVADEDPCQIMLVMKAIGLMSCPRQWKLICHDGQSTEQLVGSMQ